MRKKSSGKARNPSQKKVKPVRPPIEPEASSTSELPLELQQLLLNIFQDSFTSRFDDQLTATLQEVKGHLYNRGFAAAFGKNEYLEAYVVRWSPSRALGYLKIFEDVIKEHLIVGKEPGDSQKAGFQVTCLGGGAGAEIVGLAGAIRVLNVRNEQDDVAEALGELNVDDKGLAMASVRAMFVDIANWKHVIETLQHNITTAPLLSAYASAAARANNAPLIPPSNFDVSFQQNDVLAMDEGGLSSLLTDKDLITIFFTLNELYSTSLPKTQAFLTLLTRVVTKGSLLLVVDSAGSYSTVSLNGKEKKYPMHWLLDHTLLQKEESKKSGEKSNHASWEKLQEAESEWFRVPAGLKYPLELENMRYQLHLYRRL